MVLNYSLYCAKDQQNHWKLQYQHTAGVQTGLHNGLNRFTFVQTSLHQIIKAALYHKGVESEEDCVIWDRAKVWSLRRAYCAMLK